MRQLVIASLASTLFLLSACPRRADVLMPHPLAVGRAEPNRITHQSMRGQELYGIPASKLYFEGTLDSLDASQACFTVRMQMPAEMVPDLGTTTVVLKASGFKKVTNPRAKVDDAVMSEMPGHQPQQIPSGSSTYCASTDRTTGACQRWETQPNYRTIFVPGMIPIRTQSAEYCFDINQVVTLETEQVLLEVLDERERVVSFRWGFTGGGKKQ